MTATWEIETQLLPQYFNENKGSFFEQLLSSGTDFICDLFNSGFESYYEHGRLNNHIKYQSNEFCIEIRLCNDTDRLLCIELPPPRNSDFTYNMYVKHYFIPYRIDRSIIKVFDMFGIDTVKNIDIGFIIWYKNAQHMMSNIKLPISVNNKNDLINFMCEYIFDRI